MWSRPSHNLISNPTIKSPQIFALVSKAQHGQLMPSATAFSSVEWHLGSKSGLKAIQQPKAISSLEVLENVAAQACAQSQSLQSFKHSILSASSFNLKCLNTKSFWSGEWASWTRRPSVLVHHRLWMWSGGQQNSVTQILQQVVCWYCFKWSQCTCVKYR